MIHRWCTQSTCFGS